MLLILCAHRPEATPIIKHYDLSLYSGRSTFPVYLGDDGRIALTISGTGKVAAAAACMNLAHMAGGGTTDAWLNAGIAGHGTFEPGVAMLAHKIIDVATGRTWFPQIHFPAGMPSADCYTVDAPVNTREQALYDMEASGFLDTVTRLATLEHIHAVKVISDNSDRPYQEVTPGFAGELIEAAMPAIAKVADQLIESSNTLAETRRPHPAMNGFLLRRHFTESQRHQLSRLLSRWHCLYPDIDPLHQFANRKNARQVLDALRKALDESPVHIGVKTE